MLRQEYNRGKHLLVAYRISVLNAASRKRLRQQGCTKRRCQRCDQPILISQAAQAVASQLGYLLVCDACAVKVTTDQNVAIVLPTMDALQAVADLGDQTRN
jgi:hypothetical protein